jgi:hypothetical protein
MEFTGKTIDGVKFQDNLSGLSIKETLIKPSTRFGEAIHFSSLNAHMNSMFSGEFDNTTTTTTTLTILHCTMLYKDGY